MTANLDVRLLPNHAERSDVYRLRYSVYIEELGWNSSYADHNRRTLTDKLDSSGNLFVAFQNREPVGTLRTHHSGRDDFGPYADLYQLRDSLLANPNGIAIATMFMVRKSLRLSRVAWHLMLAAFEKALNDGINHVFIECEPSMVAFYSKLGFTTHVDTIVHPEYGPAICMSLDIHNCPLMTKLAKAA